MTSHPQVRERAGVAALDSIDTLLTILLVRLKMSIELEAVVATSAHIRVELVERDLQESKNLPALAMLYSNNNREEDALRTWQVGSSPLSDQAAALAL